MHTGGAMQEDNNTPDSLACTQVELDVETNLLGVTINLSDGTVAKAYSRAGRGKDNRFFYSCHICGVANLHAERMLQMHIDGRKHQSRMSTTIFDAEQYHAWTVQKTKVPMEIAPGEPVPPGMENEVKPTAALQSKLDAYKDGPVVGLEYLMELTNNEMPLSYHCMLCDNRGEEKFIMNHLASQQHRQKFLEKHFPSVMNELSSLRTRRDAYGIEVMQRIVRTVCEAIEDHHGRLSPNVHDAADYAHNRMKYAQEVMFDKHFDEQTGPKFVEVIDKKLLQDSTEQTNTDGRTVSIKVDHPSPNSSRSAARSTQKRIRGRGERKSLDSISSISSESVLSISSGDGTKAAAVERKKNMRLKERLQVVGGSSTRSRIPSHRSTERDRHSRRSPPARRRSPGEVRRNGFFERRRSPDWRDATRRDRDRERDRDRSRDRDRDRGRSRDRSPHRRSNRKSRSKSPRIDLKRKILPTPKELSQQASEIALERYKWEKYRCSLELAVAQLEKTLKDYEKNPEKHPMYSDEWKKFWNRRYKELQIEKKDPSKHNFKPEWIQFWTERMKQLHEEEVSKKKAEIRLKLDLPEEGNEKTDELKEQYTMKVAVTKSKEMKSDNLSLVDVNSDDDNEFGRESFKFRELERNKLARGRPRSKSPISADEYEEVPRPSGGNKKRDRELANARLANHIQEQINYDEWAQNYYGPNKSNKVFVRKEFAVEDGTLNFVTVCRLLSVLEDYLGSLGPKVIDLLSKALALEKLKANASDELLLNEDNCTFLETVKEKLKAYMITETIAPQKRMVVKKAIQSIARLVHEASKKEPTKLIDDDMSRDSFAISESVSAAGGLQGQGQVGGIDKIAIAKQLASALVAQGKVDFSSEELEQLIHVYIQMATMSKERNKIITTSAYLSSFGGSTGNSENSKREPLRRSEADDFSIRDNSNDRTETNTLASLTDSDMQTLLQNFKELSSEEQMHLIGCLKKLEHTDPVRVENLRKYVDLNSMQPSIGSSEHDNDNKSCSDDNRNNFYDEYDDQDRNGSFFGNTGATDRFSASRDSPLHNTRKAAQPTQSLESSQQSQHLLKQQQQQQHPAQTVQQSRRQLVDSDDEDDYDYDDIVRAASKNVAATPSQPPRANNGGDTEEGDTNTSGNLGSLKDTEMLVATLMESLHQSASNVTGNNTSNASTSNYTNPITTIGSTGGLPPMHSNQTSGSLGLAPRSGDAGMSISTINSNNNIINTVATNNQLIQTRRQPLQQQQQQQQQHSQMQMQMQQQQLGGMGGLRPALTQQAQYGAYMYSGAFGQQGQNNPGRQQQHQQHQQQQQQHQQQQQQPQMPYGGGYGNYYY